MGALARVAAAGCGLLTLAACTGGADRAAPPTTASAPSTTLAPSTTSAPTTTLSPHQQDEADIRALHDRFMRLMMLTSQPPNPDHPEIAATTTGIERQRIEESVGRMRDLGQWSEGDFWGEVRTVDLVDRDHAVVLDCSQSTMSLLNPDGSVAMGHEDYATLTELRVERVDGRWLVADWFTGGDQRCEV